MPRLVSSIIKQELSMLQNQICAKDHTPCDSAAQHGTTRKTRNPRENRSPRDTRVMSVKWTSRKTRANRTSRTSGNKGRCWNTGGSRSRGTSKPTGLKGDKVKPGQAISAPSLLQRPIGMTVNESQTSILKCTTDCNPSSATFRSRQKLRRNIFGNLVNMEREISRIRLTVKVGRYTDLPN